VNVGQVCNTLDRLERYRLIEEADFDTDGHVFFEITAPGRAEAMAWLTGPVPRSTTTPAELAMKLALAATLPRFDRDHPVPTDSDSLAAPAAHPK
jgi:hypothetical protein